MDRQTRSTFKQEDEYGETVSQPETNTTAMRILAKTILLFKYSSPVEKGKVGYKSFAEYVIHSIPAIIIELCRNEAILNLRITDWHK